MFSAEFDILQNQAATYHCSSYLIVKLLYKGNISIDNLKNKYTWRQTKLGIE